MLPGYTRNPYALDRVTAGSSGGTAAAVAADLGEVGLGTDTGNSIRGPSSHKALVGIRSTMGLTSRAGIAPLSLFADIAGPMARTVADAVAVFQVVAGYDPDDPATEPMKGQADCPTTRRRSCATDSRARASACCVRRSSGPTRRSRGARGVQSARSTICVRAGATVLDTVHHRRSSIRFARSGRGGVQSVQVRDQCVARGAGRTVPVKTLDSIVRTGRYHPSDPGASRGRECASSSRPIRCRAARRASACATGCATR